MSEHQQETGGALFGDDHASHPAPAYRSRSRPRRGSSCLPVLLVLLVLGGGGWYLVQSVDIDNPFASISDEVEDFPGPGQGSVAFTVARGDSISTMAANLEDLGVVASSQAFVEAATADPASQGIQEGTYQLREEMAASDVVDRLVTGETKGSSFTFTAGKTVEEVVGLLAKDTGISERKFEAALERPRAIGLPEQADGSAEGYLAPGSYTFFPDDDATSILSAMVARTTDNSEEAGLTEAADRLGYTQHELVTVASLVEAEGSLLDQQGKAKIARVIYNRLENPTAGTVGLLQIDATIDFIYGDKVARRTTDEIEAVADDPYNTYRQPGLPPGPIATPSPEALAAAADPADGPWFYYVTVNLRTGQTKFAEEYNEFLQLRGELDQYCATQSDRC